MNKLNTLLTSSLLLLPGYLSATHFEPWVPPTNEVQVGADLSYQWYRHMKYGSNSVSFHDENTYVHFDGSDTLIDRLNVEAEWQLFRSSNPDTSLVSDFFALSGRYQWLDSLCDDPISLATTLAIIFPTEAARQNPGEFHHADIDFELHVSAGKQFPADLCEQCVDDKGKLVPLVKNVRGMENYWVDLGVGHGTAGAAWMELQAAGEKQFYVNHFIRLRADYNHGFGHQRLHGTTLVEFPGYKNLNYDAVDLEARYLYEFGCNQHITATYAHRVFAKDTAGSANILTLGYNIAF